MTRLDDILTACRCGYSVFGRVYQCKEPRYSSWLYMKILLFKKCTCLIGFFVCLFVCSVLFLFLWVFFFFFGVFLLVLFVCLFRHALACGSENHANRMCARASLQNAIVSESVRSRSCLLVPLLRIKFGRISSGGSTALLGNWSLLTFRRSVQETEHAISPSGLQLVTYVWHFEP